MHLTTLLEMAGDAFADRVAFGARDGGLTYGVLLDRARRAGAWAAGRGVERIGLVDVNSDVVPTLLFGAGFAGVPFVPMNYRLADDQLAALIARTAPSVVVVEDEIPGRVGQLEGVELVRRADFLEQLEAVDPGHAPSVVEASPEDIAILLFTSGTTGDPKAAVLRHRHLASYVITTVDFMSAEEDEAALVSVPPYHVAGTSAVITGVFAGRRVVYLPAFTPESWVATARDEAVTQAMVVPTMLGRVLDLLEREGERLPHLRHLSYGGGRMPIPVLERALSLLPHVDFVNAYGLTETSSTIAVLGPDDHRTAIASDDPAVRRRLGSVGRPLPTLDVEIRDVNGKPVATGEAGEIWVRGEQVAGEYLGRDDVMVDGWFPTNDAGSLDADGFLYLEGRLDDVIVRGAENMSPGEIEDVLTRHPCVADAGVVGVPDTEWGEKVVAAVVVAEESVASAEELQEWVKRSLRSSKVPAHIAFREDLPYNETGKLLRRVLKSELAEVFGS
jgi:acyl-CoA synthetase (AMP-forming)/AMP-acid ligase II